MIELKKIPVSAYCKVYAGGDKPSAFSEVYTDEFCVPVYANGTENQGLVGYTNKASIMDKAVTIAARGSIGECFYRDEPYVPIIRLISVVPDSSKLNANYLNYYFSIHRVNGLGSVQKQITVPDVEQTDIFIFDDIDYQQKIVDIIKPIDDKIKLNNSICSDLETLAKEIYDYWFVQFDFPDENGKPYKSSGGKMVWSDELNREIPEGWEVKDILDVCDVIDCLHSKKPQFTFEYENYYMLSLENLVGTGFLDISAKYYISKADYTEWTSRIEVSEGDFVVTNAGRAGEIARIPKNVRCAIGRNLTAIHPKKIDSSYLHMFLHSFYVDSQIKSNLDSGSFFKSFNVYAIKKLKILVPDKERMILSKTTFIPIIAQIEGLISENNDLTKLRDFLLPMLMNGQIKIGA